MLTLKKDYVELPDLIDAAVETARPLIDVKHHALTIEMDAGPTLLQGDPVRITQIISNLLTNAAKYTDPGGQITLGTRLEPHYVVISVCDSGIGLAAEALSNIFEMFSQVHSEGERSDGGLGIGLALVKGLTDLHGGRVEARSAGLGKGSEFVVYLPRTSVTLGQTPAQSGAEVPILCGQRVLIADDNRDAAQSLAVLLRLLGHEVHVAHSGSETLTLATTLRPEVLVLDIGMDDLTGYEVARRIRGEDWGQQATLIAVTGWGQERDKQRARAAGFDHHLTKPVDPAVLEALLSERAPPSQAS
jgi:CheY-like chemotaxis protein